MKTISNDSEKEIEFRVYSNGEYIDIFKFHPVIGEKIWQALMDIAITGDLTALKRIAESNKLERFCQYVRDNAWQRYVFDDIRKRTPLNAYISPTQEAAFKKAILTLVSDGSIRQVFPSVDNLQTILLGNKSGAQTKVLAAVITHVRPRFLKLNGNYPLPERREFFRRLHQVFCVSPSDERSFNRHLCQIIKKTEEISE